MGAVDTPERKSKKKGGLTGRRSKRRVGVRIDMTPMVDVAFLLLIFFMVTTVFRTPKALEINLPPKDISQPVPESKTMTLRVLADGRLYWKRGAKENPWNRSTVAQLNDVAQWRLPALPRRSPRTRTSSSPCLPAACRSLRRRDP